MTSTDRVVEREEFEALRARLRRWGRWGDDDELGALNLVTESQVAGAAGLVRSGRVISLAHPIGTSAPQAYLAPRFAPAYRMTRSGDDVRALYDEGRTGMAFTDDAIEMPLQSGTHWDALAHIFHERTMYNGRGTESVGAAGASFGGINVAAARMVGRGVLLDVPRLTGRDFLEVGEAIEADDLLACCSRFCVDVRAGDFVLVRTGRLGLAASSGSWGSEWGTGANCGLGVSAAEFLASRDIAAVAADNYSVEIMPAQTVAFGERAPVHVLLLHGAGIYLGEMWALDELAADCASDGVYEFMLVAAPMLVAGAVGSPCNPQAIK